jgi:hypothetical protein
MYISIGLVIFGYFLNWILGLKPELMKETRKNALNLQERMRQAQILGDEQIMLELQQETMALMKNMLKKQFAPLIIRCVIFLGIFALLSFYYGIYENWFWVYFLFSLGFSLLAFGIRKLILRLTAKESKKDKVAKELMSITSSFPRTESILSLSDDKQNVTDSNSSLTSQINNNQTKEDSEKEQQSNTTDSWKEKMKK